MTGKGMAEIFKELDHLSRQLSIEKGPPISFDDWTAPMFEMDRDGHLLMVPRIMSEITGLTSEELCLLRFDNIIFTEDREKLAAALRHIVDGPPVITIELELFSDDVGAHPVEVTLLPTRQGQELKGYWGIIKDIKGRKALEEALDRSRGEQYRSQRFLSDFVSLLAREIRQPLTEILLTLELLHSGHFGEVNELQSARMDQVITAVERSKAILNEAIGSSKEVGREIALKRDDVDLRDIVESAVRERTDIMRLKGIQKEMDLPDRHAMAPLDRKAMSQAIGNVLDHIIGQLPPGGIVRIFLEVRENALILTISDSGPGIGDEEAAHLFDRFHVAPDREGGSFQEGLSLYLAKRIIETHDGRIWCESFLGLGTSFLVTLPVGQRNGGA